MRDSGDTATISWLIISGPVSGTYTVTASPDNDSLEGQSIVYKLKTTLTNFSAAAVYSSITITIGATTCNCQLLTWNAAPTTATQTLAVSSPATATPITLIIATANAASKSASPPIRKCYLNSGTCDESATYTLTANKNGGSFGALPSFIVQATTTNGVTVTPAGPTDVGVWTIHAVQNTASGADPSYNAITITVTCAITSFTSPTAPNLSTRTYNVWSPKRVIDMSLGAYATYAQTPNCGYAVTYSYAWTLPTSSNPLSTNGAVIEINTTDKTKAGTYSVTFSATLSETGSNSPSTTTHTAVTVTFDIIIVDPCTVTVITPPTIATPAATVKVDEDATFIFSEAVDSLETS